MIGNLSSAADIGGAIGIIVGVGGIVSTVIVMARFGALNASMQLFGLANDELRAQNENAKGASAELRLEFERKMADERTNCAREVGHLQGQVDVLTDHLADRIASAVITALDKRAA